MNERNIKLYSLLKEQHPKAECELNYKTPYQLLVAVILSAQCTDKRVNIVTEKLFKDYDTPQKIIALGKDGLIEYVRSCGLYKTKAENIILMSKILVDEYGGVVPCDMEKLSALPGVGRKTANVVMAVAFNVPAIAVDTHVFRLAHRLGLSDGKTPYDVEKDLMASFEKETWKDLHHLLIHHGRYVCKAQNPNCIECKLNGICTDVSNKTKEQ